MKSIAFIGATGLLGKPVALALANAGFKVSALVRDPASARKALTGIDIVPGDMRNNSDLRSFLKGKDYVYLSLSVKQTEKENDWHSEQQGINSLLLIAKELGIKRIFYLSSLIQRYQGMNGFDWWVTRLKADAVKNIHASGIPSTIFYPSTFMEAITSQYLQGSRLLIAGKSKYKQHFVAVSDFAKQVVKSISEESTSNKEYVVQGIESFTTDEALRIFRDNYSKRKLSISSAPLGMIKFFGLMNQKMNYGGYIIDALNNFPEKFEAENTWNELGKPTVTLAEFARNAG